ncbi:GNAT family N-acetyltransferase [Nocardioides sp.]|uniref:GNAT family N-acetyltransferase n=1 Tax=Nocardioides sp. TaxID=35761 RepID=UPI002B266EF9|nr:GNAT family N-acetyltransferase [Nocardioides sp.]
MIEVRPFEPDDLPALWALAHLPDSGVTEDDSVPVPLPVRRVPPSGPSDLVDPAATVLAPGGDLVVATRDGHLVGVGGLRPVRGRPHLGRLVRLRVHPAVRRAGVGRRLMEGLEAAARRRGVTDLMLDVGDHQPEALGFYRALGWSETWRESGPEWHWQTVWFHRSLARDHLAVEVRPCSGVEDANAAERGLPSGPNRVHHARWEQQADRAATYLLAWDGAEVVGHVLLLAATRHGDAIDVLGPHAEVTALGVADRARHRGVGTALMGAAAGVAQQQGGRTLGLALAAPDEELATLCRRLGWARHPSLAPLVESTWLDERGVEHEERDECRYWTLDLPRGATTPAQ